MTPKEQAEELFQKFLKEGIKQINSTINRLIRKNIVKQCALIAVDELLEQCNDYREIDLGKSYDYWYEVKQELHYL